MTLDAMLAAISRTQHGLPDELWQQLMQVQIKKALEEGSTAAYAALLESKRLDQQAFKITSDAILRAKELGLQNERDRAEREQQQRAQQLGRKQLLALVAELTSTETGETSLGPSRPLGPVVGGTVETAGTESGPVAAGSITPPAPDDELAGLWSTRVG